MSELRQRAPLDGEVKSEIDEADAPREETWIQHPDVVRHVDHMVLSIDDQVAELVRLLEAGDAVDMARGPLIRIRDAISDALDAPGAADHPEPRQASRFEARIEMAITRAASEAVRALVRDRRPSAVVPAERNVLVHEPDDAEVQRAAEEQAARRTRRRQSEQLSEAIVRQTNKVAVLTNFEGCSAAVLCCVGCAELGAVNMITHSLACTGIALIGNFFASGLVWAFGVIAGAVSSQFGVGMNMMVVCWIGRGFQEASFYVMRTPDELNHEWLRYYALMHVTGTLAEIGTNALFAHFIGGDIGSHAIWISTVSFYVYHLVQWPFEKRDEEGRLPPLGKYVLQMLVFPLVMWTLFVGCVRSYKVVLLCLWMRRRPCRYAILSFVIVDLAKGSPVLSVVMNGLVLPLIAASIRTSGLSIMLPIIQKNMADMGNSQSEIDSALGNVALGCEVGLALPAIALLMRNPSLGATIGSAFTLMALEVFGKQAYLGYYRLRHEGDPANLRRALDTLEVRLVYEEVGEKLCLLVAPLIAYSLDRGKEGASTVGELAFATLCVFAIEEVVDSLLLIVMAKHGVNALRVKPAFNLRSALFLGCVIATVFGFLQIAERVTWEGEEERAVFAGNSTAAPT